MKKNQFFLVVACFAFVAQVSFAEEKKETPKTPVTVQTQVVQQMPTYSVVEVQESGLEMFFRSTGEVLNGALKVVALPFHWLGRGLDYCTPKAATHRVIVPNIQPVTVTQPVIQQTVVQPVAVAPTPVSVAPAPVVVAPAPVYYPRYRYTRCPRSWHRGYYY